MKQLFAVVATCGAVGFALAVSVPADKAKRTYIDLQPKANHKLTEDFGAAGNNLGELPTGEQTFAGVKFKIGKGFIQLGSKVLDKVPASVKGLQVGKAFARLHILHATQFGGGPNREGSAWFVKDDTPCPFGKCVKHDLPTPGLPVHVSMGGHWPSGQSGC